MSRRVVKCSEGLRKKVSITIRRYIDHMRYAAYTLWLFCLSRFSYSFGSTLCHCIYRSMFCMLLFNFVQVISYVFLLLCMFHSGYSASLFCFVHCLCVNVYCTTATRCQPNCSNKYIISYIICGVQIHVFN